jgi:hypothetical protein
VCFLYNNGVIYELNSNYENLEQAIEFYKSKENNPNYKIQTIEKAYWGIYRTIGDSIIIEQHDVGHGFPLFRFIGKILNDTTFYINTSREERKVQKSIKNIVYHFQKYESKPDSTKKYVK